MLKATISFSMLLVVLMLAATEAPAKDEVYRWVDENGVVHFDQLPGEHKEAMQLDTQSGIDNNQAPAATEQYQRAEPSLAQQKRDERAALRQEAEELRAATDKACAEARQRVAKLEPSPRVMVEYEDGSVSRLDDEKRLELLADAKAYIAKNCNS